ncbi:MAG: MBL fold metallo-hydrolase [Chloroflexi bacterium]|nr:MBL fold metallo-hydrolase [Chloroflexota bacterium]
MTDWIDLGGLEFRVVSGGRFRLDGGGMFGVIPRNLWERDHAPDEKNRIELETNCVVARVGREVILIDAGTGEKLSEKDRAIFALEEGASIKAGLADVGIAAADVTMVILSHLHMDHVGGASEYDEAGRETLTFPRARYLARAGEWADAEANRSTMRVSSHAASPGDSSAWP